MVDDLISLLRWLYSASYERVFCNPAPALESQLMMPTYTPSQGRGTKGAMNGKLSKDDVNLLQSHDKRWSIRMTSSHSVCTYFNCLIRPIHSFHTSPFYHYDSLSTTLQLSTSFPCTLYYLSVSHWFLYLPFPCPYLLIELCQHTLPTFAHLLASKAVDL